MEINLNKSYKLILGALNTNCKKFVIGSTSSEYSNDGFCFNKKLNLKSKREFSSLYSLSKIIFTDLIQKLSKKSKAKFRIMRIFPTFGDGENKSRLYSKILEKAKKDEDLILNNPYEIRDFTNVNFVSKALVQSCELKFKKNFDVFHVSSNKPKSNVKFARYYWKKMKAKGKILFNKKSPKVLRHVSDENSCWKIYYE